MKVSVIGVPIKYGCDRHGAQYGPSKLREKNILDIISNHDFEVYDVGNLNIPVVDESEKYANHENLKYLKPIVDIHTNLAHLVYSTLCSDTFPFIIGGDHSLGLGSISGASKYYDNLAVIWMDAHGDINTHETSPSGNIHGMPLASALGEGEPSLSNLYYNGQKVKPDNVYIIGARDLDEGEVKLAEKLALNLYTMDTIREAGLESIIEEILNKINKSNIDGIHLSFDIDVLDKSLVPGTGTPVSHGFTIDEAKYALEQFLNMGKIKSMDLVELNPALDENDATVNVCLDLVDWTFKILNSTYARAEA